jgi:hypothetical protein
MLTGSIVDKDRARGLSWLVLERIMNVFETIETTFGYIHFERDSGLITHHLTFILMTDKMLGARHLTAVHHNVLTWSINMLIPLVVSPHRIRLLAR